ncbi:MAG: hypothetical protein AAGH15_10435 [Myxococcota bacterium]
MRRSRCIRGPALAWLVALASLVPLAGPAAAQRSEGGALESALARRHAHWVHQFHEPGMSDAQRACWNRIATRVGALTTLVEQRRALGPLPPRLMRSLREQVRWMDRLAGGGCREERTTEGEVEIDVRRHPFRPRMRRTGLTLRTGYRYELVPRAERLYERTVGHALDLALGVFARPWLRLEGTLRLGTVPGIGMHGALGGRAMLVAPWGMLRLSGGVGLALAIARDRLGNEPFGWVGPQIELPVEIGFELSERFGLSLTGGLLWTQPGEAPRDPRTVAGFAGLLLEAAI